jgi:sugar lactone lactonase YvrE
MCGPVLVLGAMGLLLPARGPAQSMPAYLVATMTGSGPGNLPEGGYGGDGGPAASAVLNLPTSVAVGPAGDIYFCDWNARIRKVDIRTGLVATIAGTGIRGFAGDGGPAVSALLGGPGRIAVDDAANVYFADAYNQRVRQVSAATGIITTVAGNGSEIDRGESGVAIQVGIGIPSGIAVDAAGNLYISNGADRVRKVEAGTGNTFIVAGAGGSRSSGDGGPAVLAQIDQPSGVALDAAGNLYIAARRENRIRKVDAATGIITTIAGASLGADSGVMGFVTYQGFFSGDGGPAIRAFLNDPEGVAVDHAGNVYISDTMNYRVRRIDAATGIIHTIAGTGVRGFSGDGGLALNAQITTPAGLSIDPAGRVYFADLFNQRIRILSPLQPLLRSSLKEPGRVILPLKQ